MTIIKLLLKMNAKYNIKCCDGRTIRSIIKTYRHPLVITAECN